MVLAIGVDRNGTPNKNGLNLYNNRNNGSRNGLSFNNSSYNIETPGKAKNL